MTQPVLPYAQAPNRDGEHLKLLAIFHYIVGGLVMLFSSIFLIYVVLGILVLHASGPFTHTSGFAKAPGFNFTYSSSSSSTMSTPFATPNAPAFITTNNSAPPAWFGIIFIVIGAIAIAIGWSIGLLVIYSGRSIVARRRHLFSLIMAGLLCAWFPFGTVLGVFTFVVLLRESVKQQYEQVASFA